jgi:hypothetical protein
MQRVATEMLFSEGSSVPEGGNGLDAKDKPFSDWF